MTLGAALPDARGARFGQRQSVPIGDVKRAANHANMAAWINLAAAESRDVL